MPLVVDLSIDSCFAVSHKRMEEKDVIADRTSLFGFL